jgi:hypothetical protein
MANDSTNPGTISSEQDATPTNETFFTDMQGEDAFFGPEQLAQATEKVVPVPQGENVIRVQVNPGEIIELSSPFDPGATLLAREGDGNLAIRVGDVTVILQGYVDANQASPVVLHSSDGQPIDIATLLASTDPTIDIQTAAGPGDAAGAQGQGADNTGGILSQLAGANGLGGLNAVGAQDATSLKYGTIDNAIRLDREDALLASGLTPFRGVAEPFLRDPVHHGAFASFHDFELAYAATVNNPSGPNPGPGWADFEGTQADGNDLESYLLQTSFTSEVIPGSNLSILGSDLQQLLDDQHITSDGSALCVEMRDGDQTAFVLRQSDKALIMVLHVDNHGDGLVIDTYLIDRVDHHDQGADQLVIEIPYEAFVFDPQSQGEGESEGTFVQGTTTVNILDDVPVSDQTDYFSAIHTDKDLTSCFLDLLGGKYDLKNPDHDAGKADEDYIFKGNHDKDNATGPDSDPLRGDESGGKIILGQVHVNFGADGPSGAIPHGDNPFKPLPGDPILTVATPQALHIDGYNVGDSVPGLTSHGHPLVVLQHELISIPTFFGTVETVEMVKVGYHPDITGGGGNSETLTSFDTEYGDTTVFTLLLQTGPNLPLFGGFAFELCQPLDHPVSGTLEGGDIQVVFNVVATDDDGDNPVSAPSIVVKINDDAPTIVVTYTNEDPKNCDPRGEVDVLSVSGGDGYGHVDHFTTKDYGHVDEDWLNGGVSNDADIIYANGPGNHDQDGFGDDNANLHGDDKGGLEVCGQIKVKFGADGPSDAPDNVTLALKTYDVPDVGSPPLFVNGDGSTLTSDGKPLVVLESSSGHLLVGVDAYFVPGGGSEGEPYLILAQKVFELNLNPDTGKFEFQLWGAIDHLPSTVDGEPESNLVLSFNVGAATDFDGDQAIGAINIKVNDDKPEVGITYCNEIPMDVGDGYTIIHKETDTDFGRIDEDWLQGGGGNSEALTIANSGNKDENSFGNSNANLFGDDYGTSHLTGQINAKFGADGPGASAIALAVLSGPFTDADGNALFSDGNALTVLSSSATSLVIGYGETTVLELTLDQYGQFDFKQSMPLDHPVHIPIEDNINLAFNAGSITDGDGDTVAAVIKIQVNDDSPEVGVEYVNNDGYYSTTVGIVDEDHVLSGVGNNDADSTPGDTDGKGAVFFDLTAGGYGADGPGGAGALGWDAQEGAEVTVKGDNGDQVLKTADGHTVLVHVAPESSGHYDLLGYYNSDGSKDFVEGGSTQVFSFSLNQPTMDGQFNLNLPVAHPTTGTEDNLLLSFGFKIGLTDGDGDPAVATINIQINDDAPQAFDNADFGIYAGNVITDPTIPTDVDPIAKADYLGADGAKVTGASNAATGGNQSADIDGDTTIAGALGLLILHANGQWVYTPSPGTLGGIDEFTYTLTDGDGDTSSAKLSITVHPEIIVGLLAAPASTIHTDFDLTLSVTKNTDATTHKDYHDGDDVKIEDTSTGFLGIGAGHTLKGGSGDDLIFGQAGGDTIYGRAGHDAQSGGDGADAFRDVDAEDLDGTHTLDGTHSIDGGDGIDTVYLSGLKTFDSTQAERIENVEILNFKGDPAGAQGTQVTLNYDACYGVTQVGGIHSLTILGDAGKDSVTLAASSGKSWVSDGEIANLQFFHAGSGAEKVTVSVEHGVDVTLS